MLLLFATLNRSVPASEEIAWGDAGANRAHAAPPPRPSPRARLVSHKQQLAEEQRWATTAETEERVRRSNLPARLKRSRVAYAARATAVLPEAERHGAGEGNHESLPGTLSSWAALAGPASRRNLQATARRKGQQAREDWDSLAAEELL